MIELAGTNGNGAFWRVMGVVLALVVNAVVISVWAGKITANQAHYKDRLDHLESSVHSIEESINEIKTEGMDDRWRRSDDVRRMEEHIRAYHNEGD